MNGGGDKRPRHSDEAAGDSEGRKRRRKSDRPTRISSESTPTVSKAEEPLPAAEPPPTVELAEKQDASQDASSPVDEADAASSGSVTSVTEPQAQTDAALPTKGAIFLFSDYKLFVNFASKLKCIANIFLNFILTRGRISKLHCSNRRALCHS